MIMRLVRDRLLTMACPPLRLVEGAAEYAARDTRPPDASLPAAFVVPLSSTAAPNGLAAGGFRQRIEEGFGVVLFHRNLRDPRGGAAALDLADDVIPAVRSALIAWQPTPAHEQVELRRAGLIAFDEGALAWREDYVTATHYRAS